MRIFRDRKFALDVTGLVLAAGLYLAEAHFRPPVSNLCLGVGTSFVFIAVSDLLVTAQRRVLDAARVRFFGRELIRAAPTFVYPDFEPHADVTRALDRAGVPMRYQRPGTSTGPQTDRWIDARYTAASNDLEAVLYVAGIFGGLSASADTLITDRRIVKSCDRSFLSFGMSSNTCTYLYFDHAGANALFQLRPEAAGLAPQMYALTSDGREFHSDDRRQYGVIARYAPDRRSHPGRRWFFIAGLGGPATIGAGWYLAQNWRRLAKVVPAEADFAAFVTVPVIAPTSAHLDPADIVMQSATGQALSISELSTSY